jgi:hypothetical protein
VVKPAKPAHFKPRPFRLTPETLEGLPPEYVKQANVATAHALNRILIAVGSKHVPVNLDKDALGRDITAAYYARDCAFDLFGGSKAQHRLKYLRRVRSTAEKLTKLLEKDAGVSAMIAGQSAKWGAGAPAQHLKQLQSAVVAIEQQQESIGRKWRTAHKNSPDLRGRRLTEAEWLAGVSLPLVFEKHFGRTAGRSRDRAGDPCGPTFHFVASTLKELGISYRDESVIRAFSRRAPLRKKQSAGLLQLQLVLRQI